MVTYLAIPKVRVTFGSTVTDGLIGGKVELVENNYWTAQLNFRNSPAIYPSIVDVNTEVLVEVQDGAVGGAWTTLFVGTVLFPDFSFSSGTTQVGLQCVGLGYALNAMNVAEEYGTQSRNPNRETISEILTNNSEGIIPQWVELYRKTANDSGYLIDTSNVNSVDLTEIFSFISFPWKPANKCLDDICDLHTAIAATSSKAGAHWIVDHDAKLRVKRIGISQVGWTKYYGDSQANATLVNGEDFFDGDFQPVGKEANVILYNGTWRKPSNGDAWTEYATDGTAQAAYYNSWPAHLTISHVDASGDYIVGQRAVQYTNDTVGGVTINYPNSLTAGWNLNGFSEFNTPSFQFYLQISSPLHNLGAGAVPYIKMCTAATDYFYCNLGLNFIPEVDKFFHFSYPIGPYGNLAAKAMGKDSTFTWTKVNNGDWANINYYEIYLPMNAAAHAIIDGAHFGDASIIRIARQCFPTGDSAVGTLGTTTNPIRFKVITDNIGKDDTLTAGTPGTTDMGLMAQLAKAELLRASKETVNGRFTTPLIADVLPGQYFYIGKDWRITKVTHNLATMQSTFEVTDDVTNSHTRMRYEDINKQYAAIRPEYQDRQASSLKSGSMDIRILPLEEAYDI
jgi:hypothetical protein